MAKNKQSFIEGALVLTLAAVLVKIVGALYRIPLTAAIGEDGIGFYSTAYNFYLTVYSIAVSGFPTAISKIVAAYAAENRYKDVRRVVSVARVFLFIIGVVCTVALILVARPYVDWAKSPKAYYCVLAVAPSIIFSCLMSTHRGYNQGMSNMIPTAVSQVIEVLFKAVGGLAGAYVLKNYFTNEYMASGTVFGSVMASAQEAEVTILSLAAAGAIFGVSLSTLASYLFLLVRRAVVGDGISQAQLQASPDAHANRYIFKQLLTIGIPIALSAVAVTLTGLIDNMSILNRLAYVISTDPGTLYASHGGVLEQANKALEDLPNYLYGVYNIGMPLFNLVPAITGSFAMSALPHVTAAWTLADRQRTRLYAESSLRITLLIAAPAGFGISFMAGPIMRLLYPTRAVGTALAEPMLTLLGLAAIFVALMQPINAMLQGVGRVDIPVKLMLLGGAIKLATNYYLVAIPSLNIKAAPLGNLLCYMTISLIGLAAVRRLTGISLDLRSAMLKPMLAGLLTGSFALLTYNALSAALHMSGRLATVAGIAVGAAVYLIAIGVMQAVEPEDIVELPGGKKIVGLLEKLRVIR
ncbi:MAG: polysaccharide biosynthesis protein [Oscillospiraceae bacterium]|nr:polysaccharide biosynthesis protein [Oscillospiraceae bacterium]